MKILILFILNNVFYTCLCLSWNNNSRFGARKGSQNRVSNIKSVYGFINQIGINEYYRNNKEYITNGSNSNVNFKLFNNEDMNNINEEDGHNESRNSLEDYEFHEDKDYGFEQDHNKKYDYYGFSDDEEYQNGLGMNNRENDNDIESMDREDMFSNQELSEMITNRNLKIPYIIDYPTDKVEEEPGMTKEDVARSVLSELGFFNESDYSVGTNPMYFDLNYNTTTGSNVNDNKDYSRSSRMSNMSKSTGGSRISFAENSNDNEIDDYEPDGPGDEYGFIYQNQEFGQDQKECEFEEDGVGNEGYRDDKDSEENGNDGRRVKEIVLKRRGYDRNGSGEEEEDPINRDYLVRTSAIDKLAPKIEEGSSPSILEDQESPVIGKQRVRWFPNYVSKSLRKLHDYIKLSDIILDVRDGRVPFIPPNDYLFNLFESEFPTKPRITVFTHSDILPKVAMAEWMNYYRKINKSLVNEYNKNISDPDQRKIESKTMFVDARNGLKEIIYLKKHIYKMCRKIRMKSLEKGMKPRAIRAIVIGMPNVGKSSLINRILGRRVAKAYDIPGTTRDINIYNEEKGKVNGNGNGRKDKLISMIDTPGFVCPIQDNHRFLNDYNSIFSNRIISNSRKGYEIGYGYGYERDRRMLIYSGLNIIGEAAYEVDEVALVVMEEIIKMLMQNPKYIEHTRIKQKYPLLASLINKYTPMKKKATNYTTGSNVNKDTTRSGNMSSNNSNLSNNNNSGRNSSSTDKTSTTTRSISNGSNKDKDENNIRYDPDSLEHEISVKMDRLSTWLFGGNLDSCCAKFLTDFRKGKLGQIMLQSPPMLYNFYLNYLDGNRKYKMEKARKRSKNVDKVVEYKRGVYEGW